VKRFFLEGDLDGVSVRWLVPRSADGAVMWSTNTSYKR
jgi:hypothetical protein